MVCHHVGSLPGGLGPAGHGTRVADWIDLAAPLLVLPPALMALLAAGASRRVLGVFAVGSWVYASGHGLHLAANSVGNVAPGPTAHFWDEDAGHAVWFTGLAIVAGCLVVTLRDRSWPVRASKSAPASVATWERVVAGVLAVAVGLTWASNALGGHFWAGALVGIAALLVVGWRGRRAPTVLCLVAAVPSLALLVDGLVASGGWASGG